MLKKLLFVSLVIATLASCNKDKEDSPSSSVHISAKIDGVSTTFNAACTGMKFMNGNTVTISGAASMSQSFPQFGINLSDDVAITTKTYTGSTFKADGTYGLSYSSMFVSDNDFTVTVTSISSTEIKGTFSGKLIDGSTTKNITEGSFYVKFL
jgi:hypothetical protein